MADKNAGFAGNVYPSWIADGERVNVEVMDGTSITGRIAMPVSFRQNMVMIYDGDTRFIKRFIPMANVQEITRLVEPVQEGEQA